jgi:hypothetical protein
MSPHKRPGYTQIEAVSFLASDSKGWETFMRDVLNMPLSMLTAVQHVVVKRRHWMIASDPLKQVKSAAENWAARQALALGQITGENQMASRLGRSIRSQRYRRGEIKKNDPGYQKQVGGHTDAARITAVNQPALRR